MHVTTGLSDTGFTPTNITSQQYSTPAYRSTKANKIIVSVNNDTTKYNAWVAS